MGLRGRHRRYRPSRVNRASLTVTAGGASMALPLLGAGAVAHAAAPAGTLELSERPVRTLPGQAPADGQAARGPAQAGSEAGAGGGTYTVAGGDTLSRIATAQRIEGGWQPLYAANRKVVGSDPNMILPGQRLSLVVDPTPESARTTPEAKTAPAPAPAPEKKAEKPEPKAEKPEARKPAKEAERKPAAEPEKRASDTDRASRTTDRFSAPVTTGPSTPYRSTGSSWSRGYHTGVDFPVPTGTAVKAVAPGRVVSAGWAGSYGYEVVVRHTDGKYSQYAHLSALTVRGGQQVGAGQRLGRSGSTGNSTGPHLHFEIRTGPGFGSDVDPLAYLRAHGVRI